MSRFKVIHPKYYKHLTLKDMRGRILPIGQVIACHFSQDHTMVTNFLDFNHKHPKYKVVKSLFYYLDRFSRNLAETDKTSWFFEIENREIDFFSFFFSTKVSDFVSNLNCNCSQLSFKVYIVYVAQKLPISRFLIDFFSSGPWPLQRPPEAANSTSATSIGYQILEKYVSFHMRYC